MLKAMPFGNLCTVKDGFVVPRLIFILFPIIQRLRTERDSLKETIEELRCVQAQEGQLTTTGKGQIRILSASFLKYHREY